jgi:hypothetical protein
MPRRLSFWTIYPERSPREEVTSAVIEARELLASPEVHDVHYRHSPPSVAQTRPRIASNAGAPRAAKLNPTAFLPQGVPGIDSRNSQDRHHIKSLRGEKELSATSVALADLQRDYGQTGHYARSAQCQVWCLAPTIFCVLTKQTNKQNLRALA